MNRKLSDEQLDRIAENLVREFALDDETLDEIAASPQLWRNVRRQIEAEKSRRAKSWFFVFRPPIIAFGAAAVTLFVLSGVWFLNTKTDAPIARIKAVETPQTTDEIVSPPSETQDANVAEKRRAPQNVVPQTTKVFPKKTAPKISVSAKTVTSQKIVSKPKAESLTEPAAETETKTDFIALSYSTATDSGQIVRVKVPSSMMVSLGVTTEIKPKSELVNAEVIIGDDGMARAIRFIR